MSTPAAEPSGPTPEEIAAERQRKREKAAREKAAREQALAEELAREQAAQQAGVESSSSPVLPDVPDEEVAAPPAEEPAVVEAAAVEPAAQAVAAPVAATGGSASAVSDAAPVLLGLLALAMILLGIASIPPWTLRSTPFAGLLAQRRTEIGLIGTAILASAAIGLAIAVTAN